MFVGYTMRIVLGITSHIHLEQKLHRPGLFGTDSDFREPGVQHMENPANLHRKAEWTYTAGIRDLFLTRYYPLQKHHQFIGSPCFSKYSSDQKHCTYMPQYTLQRK